MAIISSLLNTTSLLPHGFCIKWSPSLLWSYVIADSFIALAYYSIPVTLAFFVWRRKDLEFRWIFILFSAFILACGTTHLLGIVVLWNPLYWLDASMKGVTAIISMATAIALVWLLPKALKLPSPAQLDKEVQSRLQAYEALKVAQLSLVDANQSLEKRVSERTHELNLQKNIYEMLSQTNQAIVRIKNRDELLQEICRIAVDIGKFRFIWVGIIEHKSRQVVPTYRHGDDNGYIDNLHITLDDAIHGPTLNSIFSGTPSITNDFFDSTTTAPWQEAAKRSGIKGCGVFPIKLNGEVIGTLNFYADEIGYFTEVLLPTLNEISHDVSFALDNFTKEEDRQRQSDELKASAEQFRGLVEQAIVGIYIIQDEVFAYCNHRFSEILGYGSSHEIIGLNPMVIVDEIDRKLVADNIRIFPKGEERDNNYSFNALRKDGSKIIVGVHGACASYLGKPAIIGLLQDISEKKRDEEKINLYIKQLQDAFMNTVEVAMNLSEMRDPYTAGHERRVAEIAVAISAELGCDAERQQGMRVAGYLHDIGKITIPAEILSKPGRLSEIEYTLIKGHAQASYDVLKNVDFPWPVAQVALQHHERIDGTGYPQGLKGEGIIIEARILAVADVIEAMSSHRPYRAGLGIDKSLAEIKRGRGTAYDENVVDAALRLFNEKDYKLSE